MREKNNFPFPIIIGKEGKWHVAACPLLDLATQGKTEREVRDNLKGLIEDYLSDLLTLTQLLNLRSLCTTKLPLTKENPFF